MEEFEPREVRRILVGHYEMHYEIQESVIYGFALSQPYRTLILCYGRVIG